METARCGSAPTRAEGPQELVERGVRLAIVSCRPPADVRAKQVQRAGRDDIGSRARRGSTPSSHDRGALISTGPCCIVVGRGRRGEWL